MGINQGPISLDQKYTQGSGHVFLTGIQALVRLAHGADSSRDRANGLHYGGFHQRLPRLRRSADTTSSSSPARKHLEQYDIKFQPGVNEDLCRNRDLGFAAA